MPLLDIAVVFTLSCSPDSCDLNAIPSVRNLLFVIAYSFSLMGILSEDTFVFT